MEGQKRIIYNNVNINQININKEENLSKKVLFIPIKKIKFNRRYFNIINPFFFFFNFLNIKILNLSFSKLFLFYFQN